MSRLTIRAGERRTEIRKLTRLTCLTTAHLALCCIDPTRVCIARSVPCAAPLPCAIGRISGGIALAFRQRVDHLASQTCGARAGQTRRRWKRRIGRRGGRRGRDPEERESSTGRHDGAVSYRSLVRDLGDPLGRARGSSHLEPTSN